MKSLALLQPLSHNEMRKIEGGRLGIKEIAAGITATFTVAYNTGYAIGKAIYHMTH